MSDQTEAVAYDEYLAFHVSQVIESITPEQMEQVNERMGEVIDQEPHLTHGQTILLCASILMNSAVNIALGTIREDPDLDAPERSPRFYIDMVHTMATNAYLKNEGQIAPMMQQKARPN